MTEKTKIKAAIFDLDGTLVHLPIDYEKLLRKFAEILGTTKVRPLTKVVAKADKEKREKIFEIWTAAEMEALSKLEVIEEGMRLYRKYSDIKRALITMQGKKALEKILERTGLSFHLTVTREDSLSRVEQINIVLKKLELSPRSVVVIGDRDSDKRAAERIGCAFIRVEWASDSFKKTL